MNKYGNWMRFVFILFLYWINLIPQCVSIQINEISHNIIPLTKLRSFAFVNSPYPVSNYPKFHPNNLLTECKLLAKDKSLTHLDSQPTQLPAESKKTPLVSNVKTLLTTKSSDLTSYVTKFVKNVKKSNVYKYLTDTVDKAKKRLSNLSTFDQFCLLFLGSALHTFVLSRFRFILPYQLFPMDSGHGIEISLDTLISIPILYYLLKDSKFTGKYFQLPEKSVFKMSMVVFSLLGSFVLSSFFSQLIDDILLFVSALDFPVSSGMLKSISLMSSHLFWIFLGSLILDKCVFPVFSKNNPWYKVDLSKLWVYQVLMGYYSSFPVYRFAEMAYLYLLKVFDIRNETNFTDEQISKICASDETLPIMITLFGPCVTAPWWEELLYRVFVFKLFNSFLPSIYSSIASSLIFSLNHLSPHSFLQLFSIGLLWSLIENKNDNIIITFLIHSLWNSRIFFGSLAGI
ncbi:CAAX protease self-immunity family protein [Theileria parva strain Muguga]|uniref:CAAX prenyl protease 2/Lysostaphin resistance protein A-like domain-containing protein n=1 Tax=Theileria parva TaxID=5875 RepID=Q4MYS1_THEPA|nr:CAAX protease self-immunity family protein [Theileria parva strain Muguga]EAN30611.1 CAAX protease self-immunity family protein [Theileria parva strain Muguga]|eukprot:XP_762894.1 hypothetical protein [Theileria parva strain Muguga]